MLSIESILLCAQLYSMQIQLLVQLDKSLQNAKAQVNSEMLRRVDAENQMQTLHEQIEFQKQLSEQVGNPINVFVSLTSYL